MKSSSPNSFPALALAVTAALALGHSAQAANTADTYTGSVTGNVTTGSNWSLGTAPLVTNDAVFNNGTGIRNFGTGASPANLTVGSFNVTPNSGTYTLRNDTSGATNVTLTLGGAGNLGNGISSTFGTGSSSDLIFAAYGSTFNLTGTNGGGGTGVLGIALAESGNFNIAGTSAISSIITGAFGLTKTGAGTLTLSATNTFSGGLNISSGTVDIGTNNAVLGGTSGTAGAVTLNGGALQITQSQTDTHVITVGSNGGVLRILAAGNVQTYNLGVAGDLTGSGTLTVTGDRGIGINVGGNASKYNSVLVMGNANSGYTGNMVFQSGGTAEITNAGAVGTGGTFTLNDQGQISLGVSLAKDITVNNGGILGFNVNNVTYSGAITLNGAANARLQYWYTNTAATGETIGAMSGSGSLSVTSGNTSGGTLALNGTNTFTGGLTVAASTVSITGNSTGMTGPININSASLYNGVGAGTLTLNGNTGSLSSTATVNINGGTFNYQGATAGSTLDATAYTFGGGDRNYQSTYGTSGNTSLSLANSTRTAGTTNNYSTSGGTNGTTNKITFTSAPGTGALIDKGDYFGGTSYAAYDATNSAVRAYGSGDTNYSAQAASSTGFVGTTAASNVDVTGAITNQTTTQINTLRLGTTNAVTMTAANTLTVDGILKSGGNAATITGGSGIQASSGGEMVIRTNASGDTLTISTVILDNSTSSLTKSGLGTLNLNSVNTYAGGTTLNAGVIVLGNNSGLGTGTLTMNGGVLQMNAKTISNNIAVGANASAMIDNTGNNSTLNGNISGSGTLTIGNSSGNNLSAFLGGSNYSGFTGTLNYFTSGNVVNIFAPGSTLDLSNAAVNFLNPGNVTNSAFKTNGSFATKFGSLSGYGYIEDNGTVEIGNLNTNTNFWGIISLAGGVTKVGTGTLTLSGANSYSGGTTVKNGTLVLGYGGSLSASTTLTIGDSATNTNGTFQLGDSLNAVNTTVTSLATAGTGTSNAIVGGNVNVSTLNVNNGGAVTYGGKLGGAGTNQNNLALLKTNSGQLTLSGSNTYSGGTTVNAGTLSAANNNALGSGALNLNGATLNNAGAGSDITLTNNIALTGANSIQPGTNKNLTISGGISGSGSLTMGNDSNNVSIFFGGTNSMTSGTITLANNTNAVRISSTNAGNANVAWVFNNTGVNRDTLDFGTGTISFGSMTGAGILQNNTAGGVTQTISAGALGTTDTFSGAIKDSSTGNGSGTIAFTKVGTGTMSLTGANTYAGGTTVKNGTLVLGTGGSLSTSNTLTLGDSSTNANGIFQLGNGGGAVNTTVTSLAKAGTGTLNAVVGGDAAVSTLTVNNGGAVSYSGKLGGAGTNQNNLALTKTGAGTLTLSSSNTYTGGTTVTTGIVNFGNASAFGTGSITLNGGTIQAGGGFTLANNIVVSASSVIDMVGNNTAFNGNLSGSSAVSFTDSGLASTATLSGNNSGFSGTFTMSGNGNGNAVDFTSANAGSASAAWVFNDAAVDRVRIKIAGGGTINFGSLAGSGQMQNDTSATTSTISVGALGTSTTFSGTMKDNGTGIIALTKVGSGMLTLTGANAYTGTTTVSGGTLNAAAANALQSTSAITVSTGGTLLISNNASTNHVNNSATINLNGGTLAIDPAQEGVAATKTGGTVTGTSTVGLGALTLSANSTLDFDSASNGNLLVFATGFTDAGNAFKLNITNWTNANFNGTTNSGQSTDDRLVFNQDMSSFITAGDITFDGSAVGVTQIQLDSGFYEIGVAPVPEPSTWVGAGLITGLAGWSQRRRLANAKLS
ncbi:MAG: autotransporter-associated beta strand repeat-containing protein [Chthoniobacterales bacterium]